MTTSVDGETESLDPLTDDELADLALAADPDALVDDDAVCLWDLTGDRPNHRLPEWYMPSPMGARLLYGWRRRVIVFIILAFVLIDAYGLCNTYGRVAFG
jgi:hypothetical protein